MTPANEGAKETSYNLNWESKESGESENIRDILRICNKV